MIRNQLAEMASRIDTLETSLRKDIHSILDLLHQQQQMQFQMHQQQLQQAQSQTHLSGRYASDSLDVKNSQKIIRNHKIEDFHT